MFRVQIKLVLLHYLYGNLLAENVTGEKKALLLKMDPEEVAETFKSLLTSKYMRDLANIFAAKAADKFVKVVESKHMEHSTRQRPPENNKKLGKSPSTNIEHVNIKNLYSLLKDPSPDGDNLEIEDNLSEVETKGDTQKSRPKQKINGVYFRRSFNV